jgi:hypothetical protein
VTHKAPIPVSIVTGFLGAGKTTLLNKLLGAPELAGVLVIVNEWGEIGLDHLLIERVDGDVILLSSGCVCCSLRGDSWTPCAILPRGATEGASRRSSGSSSRRAALPILRPFFTQSWPTTSSPCAIGSPAS